MLDFKHYLHGVVGLSLPFTTDEALKDMFQVGVIRSCGVFSGEEREGEN